METFPPELYQKFEYIEKSIAAGRRYRAFAGFSRQP
jgi:hypothetical protein